MKETAKTIALLVLGFLYVLLALHQPEIPKAVEHPVELSPAFIAMEDELAKAKEALTAAKTELQTYKAAAAEAAAEKEREAKWAAAGDAEARGALRTASKLYDDYAKTYPDRRRSSWRRGRPRSSWRTSRPGRRTLPLRLPPPR